MVNLDSLQFFADLIETGSFSRTAEKNFVSQSAVSQRLKALENDYSQTLIDRGQGRGRVTPTTAGLALYAGSKALLQGAMALDAEMRQLSDEVAGTVRVATVYSVGLHALPPRLKPFLAAHPRVNVHLEYKQTDKVYDDVVSGSVDVGIVACPSAKRGLEVVPFAEEEMVLVCAPEHPLAGPEVSLRQLDGIAFIGFADDIPTRKLVDERLRAAGARVKVVSMFDNIETIKNLVEIGSGVSILPADTVRQEQRAGTLTAVHFTAADAFTRPTGLLLKKTKSRRAAVRAFVEAMQN
ncbi:MAG: LysR family transcriptional regulator [Janthinobacterium lividum]